jgi:hypothetical protein
VEVGVEVEVERGFTESTTHEGESVGVLKPLTPAVSLTTTERFGHKNYVR